MKRLTDMMGGMQPFNKKLDETKHSSTPQMMYDSIATTPPTLFT